MSKPIKPMTEKEKYKQCDKEALITLIVFFAYFIWWWATGYGISDKGVDNSPWIMGLPLWFFLSCIVGWILCIIVITILVKTVYVDMDMGSEADSVEVTK